jgi:hypothetical protein
LTLPAPSATPWAKSDQPTHEYLCIHAYALYSPPALCPHRMDATLEEKLGQVEPVAAGSADCGRLCCCRCCTRP